MTGWPTFFLPSVGKNTPLLVPLGSSSTKNWRWLPALNRWPGAWAGVCGEGAADAGAVRAIKLARVKPQWAGVRSEEAISLAVELSSGRRQGSTVNYGQPMRAGAPTATLCQRPSLLGNARQKLVYHDQEPRILHPSSLPLFLEVSECRDRPSRVPIPALNILGAVQLAI